MCLCPDTKLNPLPLKLPAKTKFHKNFIYKNNYCKKN